MSSTSRFGNSQHLDSRQALPRMVSEIDVEFVRNFAQELLPDAVAVELGPWMGALSAEIAGRAKLHAIDNFVWTKDHDRRAPGVLAPGDSFEDLYKNILKARGLEVTTHKSNFAECQWEGASIDLCVVDSPKSAETLQECLEPFSLSLKPDARLIVINGANPKFHKMVSYINNLLYAKVFEILPSSVSSKSKAIALTPGVNIADLSRVPLTADTSSDFLNGFRGMADPAPFLLVGIADLVESGAWQQAYGKLSVLQPDPDHLKIWENLETELSTSEVDRGKLGTFSEMVAVHNDKWSYRKPPSHFHKSAALSLRAFWLNNADKSWRGTAFSPEILTQAFQFGYMSWASKVRDLVRGKDVLDVGCGPGLHGLGYLTAGAKSYTGMDPIIKPDADRVKNLSAVKKMPFGWTPNDLMDRIDPWKVCPTPIGDYDPSKQFDIAVLHNVTEHLHGIEEIFADIALRLREGGVLLYNHHNFYTWNGHHLPPKTLSAIDMSDPGQLEMMDWGHVEYEPDPAHYIARGLNRLRLDELVEITRQHFDIEIADEIASRPQTGSERLTDKIRRRYPYLEDRDFLTQNLYCVAKVRG